MQVIELAPQPNANWFVRATTNALQADGFQYAVVETVDRDHAGEEYRTTFLKMDRLSCQRAYSS